MKIPNAQKKIYVKDWLALKPYEIQTSTDVYYLKLSNKVKDVLTKSEYRDRFAMYIEEEDVNLLACFLISYLEDLVSGTNVWNSFVRIHKRLYDKQLPFYKLDPYYEEEINIQDVCFLIWYFLNTIQDDRYFEPFADFIPSAAKEVMGILEEAWDYAPENEHLRSFYTIDSSSTESNYYVAKDLIDIILFKTYLFHTDILSDFEKSAQDILEEELDWQYKESYLTETHDSYIHKARTRLLGLSGKEWASEIAANNPIAMDFLEMSPRINGFFTYQGEDTTDIFLEHVASGKNFKLTKKSFDQSFKFNSMGTTVGMGIVKWKDEWWFTGLLFEVTDQGLIEEEKNSPESRQEVEFLDEKTEELDKIFEKQLQAFKRFNNDSQIAFMPADRIEEFVKTFVEFYNQSLNLSDEEYSAIEDNRNEKDAVNEFEKIGDIYETGLVFFNPKKGIELAFDVNFAFPLPINPFFDSELSDEHVRHLLTDDSISKELVLFCIENCKNDLPLFESVSGIVYLRDLDFLLRFWKRQNYFTEPTVHFGSIDKDRA